MCFMQSNFKISQLPPDLISFITIQNECKKETLVTASIDCSDRQWLEARKMQLVPPTSSLDCLSHAIKLKGMSFYRGSEELSSSWVLTSLVKAWLFSTVGKLYHVAKPRTTPGHDSNGGRSSYLYILQ